MYVGAIPLSASALDLSSDSPSIISLECTGNEALFANCIHSTSGVCGNTSNAALRCLRKALTVLYRRCIHIIHVDLSMFN